MVELAEKVRLSHTPCWRRVKRLESDGVIKERAVILDAGQLGLSINVYAQVRLRQHDEETPNALGAPRGLPVSSAARFAPATRRMTPFPSPLRRTPGYR